MSLKDALEVQRGGAGFWKVELDSEKGQTVLRSTEQGEEEELGMGRWEERRASHCPWGGGRVRQFEAWTLETDFWGSMLGH